MLWPRISLLCVTIALCVSISSSVDSANEEYAQPEHDRVKRVSVQGVDKPDSNANFPGETRKFRSRDTGGVKDATAYSFPIVMPPYGEAGVDYKSADEKWGSCLVYMESLAVVLFTEKASAVAIVRGGDDGNAKYNFGKGSLDCLTNATAPKNADKLDPMVTRPFGFRLDIDIKAPVESKAYDADPAKQATSPSLFSIKAGKLSLVFNFLMKTDYTWNLTSVTANSLSLGSGSLLKGDLDVNGKESAGEDVKLAGIGSFSDYSFACSSTRAFIFFPSEKKDIAVGVSLGNFQFQPFGIYTGADKDGKDAVRFTRHVNDCVGLFSVGSLMGILVSLILTAVLFFGYLMLNSVQTGDRFDDPKQKQLIISAKE